jgi:hypothetical protein
MVNPMRSSDAERFPHNPEQFQVIPGLFSRLVMAYIILNRCHHVKRQHTVHVEEDMLVY